jgi:hypothetical protein
MDAFPRCVTSQVHILACIEAAVGDALLVKTFIDQSQPLVSALKDFVMLGGSHAILLLCRVEIGVICTYVCTAAAWQLL